MSPSRPPIALDQGLTLRQLVSVSKGAKLELSRSAWQRVRDARGVIERVLESRVPTYGLNTGLGSLKKYVISDEQIGQFNADVVIAHAVSEIGRAHV